MRLAIVTPWYGEDLIGGAERLAWDLSHALARAGSTVEVLTTCCRSFHDDWSANYHRPRATREGDVVVRRFRVDPRDRVAFSRANSALLALRQDELRRDRPPLPPSRSEAFITQSIRSRTLAQHLRERGSSYDALLFLPYLYGTTLDGLALVADRAFLVSCLHDEAYAYLDAVRDCFRRSRGLLFNSEGELNVAASLYGPWVRARSAVIGHAVDVVTPPSEAISIRGFVPQRSRYVLFLGRGDRTKNVDLAIHAFERYRQMRRTASMQLVIAGPHAVALRGKGIVDLGAVTEEEKAALLANARALVQPSTNESFSRTVHEAWHVRRPVVVHADCAATAELVASCGGGWVARTVEEWANVFTMLDEAGDSLVDGLGMRGRSVALQMGSWDDVAARALECIRRHSGQRSDTAILALDEWPGPRAPEPFYDDGSLNVLSVAPLNGRDAGDLAAIVARVRKKAGPLRLFVFDEDCASGVREQLVRALAELGMPDALVALGDDVNARFAALRDAHVACAFGSPLETTERLRLSTRFEIPIVAFEEVTAREIIGAYGVLCGREVREAAMVLYVVATDADLRHRIVAEMRRIDTRGLPKRAPSGTVRSRTDG